MIEQDGRIKLLDGGGPVGDGVPRRVERHRGGRRARSARPRVPSAVRDEPEFFVFYTTATANEIARYQVSATDPNKADPTTKTVILSIPDFATNHNGGMMEFGPTATSTSVPAMAAAAAIR